MSFVNAQTGSRCIKIKDRQKRRVRMKQGFQVLLQVFGGLALFLYGTDSLCRAVQQGAGRRLRGLLARCTANPVAGLLTGAAVTAVLQSLSLIHISGDLVHRYALFLFVLLCVPSYPAAR